MYFSRLLNRTCPIIQTRGFCNFPTLRDSKLPNVGSNAKETAGKAASETTSSTSYVMGPRMIETNKRDKWILVWFKYYKTVADVPQHVKYDVLDKAHNKFRIRISNIMLIVTAIGLFFAAYTGRKKAEQGASVDQMNIDWHEKIEKERQESLKKAEIAKTV